MKYHDTHRDVTPEDAGRTVYYCDHGQVHETVLRACESDSTIIYGPTYPYETRTAAQTKCDENNRIRDLRDAYRAERKLQIAEYERRAEEIANALGLKPCPHTNFRKFFTQDDVDERRYLGETLGHVQCLTCGAVQRQFGYDVPDDVDLPAATFGWEPVF